MLIAQALCGLNHRGHRHVPEPAHCSPGLAVWRFFSLNLTAGTFLQPGTWSVHSSNDVETNNSSSTGFGRLG